MSVTITEDFRDRMDACCNKEERLAVWRTAAWAYEGERLRRGIGGPDPVVYRRAAIDEGLPIPWQPYWSRLTDLDLLTLADALSRSRIRT